MTPDFEIPFRSDDATYVALVYGVCPELLVRDVTVFETRGRGAFRFVGLGVWGKRFVAVKLSGKRRKTVRGKSVVENVSFKIWNQLARDIDAALRQEAGL